MTINIGNNIMLINIGCYIQQYIMNYILKFNKMKIFIVICFLYERVSSRTHAQDNRRLKVTF